MARNSDEGVAIQDLALYFLRLGVTGFGGPAALADRMRSDLVESRRWLTHDEFDLGLTIAASCPGPMAYQLAVYCGFIRRGIGGAMAVAVAFAAAPFALVVSVAAAYSSWNASPIVRGAFYGAAPAVTVLIARATWNLGKKTLHRSYLAWIVCGGAAIVTAITGREPLWYFAMAGLAGALWLRPSTPSQTSAVAPVKPRNSDVVGFPAIGAFLPTGVTASLFGFFFTTGCLVFGSGLAIVPFLRTAVVDERHWLTVQQFLDSVTVGLISPGPVVITATFVGYQVDQFAGAVAATAGIFLPTVLLTIAATPWFIRHRRHPGLGGFVRGMTAAVIGVLAGTVPIVCVPAVPDVPAAVILVAVAIASRWRMPDPLLVLAGASLGITVAARA